MSKFGDEIRRLRDGLGLTQKQLAEAADTAQPVIARLEKGTRSNLYADVLYRLCRALKVPCSHFEPFLANAEAVAQLGQSAETKPKKSKKSGSK